MIGGVDPARPRLPRAALRVGSIAVVASIVWRKRSAGRALVAESSRGHAASFAESSRRSRGNGGAGAPRPRSSLRERSSVVVLTKRLAGCTLVIREHAGALRFAVRHDRRRWYPPGR